MNRPDIAVIKRSASWRNPAAARKESEAIISNAANGPVRPSSIGRTSSKEQPSRLPVVIKEPAASE